MTLSATAQNLDVPFRPNDHAENPRVRGLTNFSDLNLMRAMFFGTPGPSGLPNACNFNQVQVLHRLGMIRWNGAIVSGSPFVGFGLV